MANSLYDSTNFDFNGDQDGIYKTKYGFGQLGSLGINQGYTGMPGQSLYESQPQLKNSYDGVGEGVYGKDWMYDYGGKNFADNYKRKAKDGHYFLTKEGYEHYFGTDPYLKDLPANAAIPADYQGERRKAYSLSGMLLKPDKKSHLKDGFYIGNTGKQGYPVYYKHGEQTYDDLPNLDYGRYVKNQRSWNYRIPPTGNEDAFISNRDFYMANPYTDEVADVNQYPFVHESQPQWMNKLSYDSKDINSAYDEAVKSDKQNRDEALAREQVDNFKKLPPMQQMQPMETEQSLDGTQIQDDETDLHRRENRYGKLAPLKYAGLVGSALNVFSDAMGWTNKPDYGPLDQYNAEYNRNTHADYMPIGNYQKYKPMDRDYYINMINAQVGAKRRAVLDMANGNRAQAAAMLAGVDANGQQSMSDLIMNADKENLTRYDAAKRFNQDTDKTNAANFLEASKTNAALYENKLNQSIEAAKLRFEIDKAASSGKSANLTNLFNNIKNVGENFENKNSIATDPRLYFYQDDRGGWHYKQEWYKLSKKQQEAILDKMRNANDNATFQSAQAEANAATRKERTDQYGVVPDDNGYLTNNNEDVDKKNPYKKLTKVSDSVSIDENGKPLYKASDGKYYYYQTAQQ